MNWEESWIITRTHLDRAKTLLPNRLVEGHPAGGTLRQYRECLDHNELELALDQLESVGEKNPCPPEFWAAMEAAASSMKLVDWARYYRSKTESP